jgi:hypothetical protein
MKTVSIARCPINELALQAELSAELGAEYVGLSTTPEELVLHFVDAAPLEVIMLAQIIVKSHDPLALTAAQQAEQERLQALAEANTQYATVLDSSQYASESALIIELAERLRRLELLVGGQDAG